MERQSQWTELLFHVGDHGSFKNNGRVVGRRRSVILRRLDNTTPS